MFTTRTKLMLAPVSCCGDLVCRYPRTFVVATIILVLPASWLGFDCWRARHQRAALRDFRLDLLASAYEHQQAHLQSFPDDYAGHLFAARVTRLLGDFSQSEFHLNECTRLRGNREEIQLQFLLMRALGGELLYVEPGLMKCLETKKHYVLVLEGLVQSYMKELRYRSAAAWLYKWLDEEPDSVRALNWRGWVLENLDLSEEAMADYRRALQLSPQHATARLRLANMLLAASKVPETSAHLAVLEAALPDNPDVLIALSQCRTLQARQQDAIGYLDRLLSQQPDNVRALYLRGKLDLDPVDREKWFRRALKNDPSFHDASYALYTALNQQPGREVEAAKQLKSYEASIKVWKGLKDAMQALERSPYNPDLLAKVGSILLTRDPATAQSFLYKALMFAPEHRLANEVLARYFEEKNEPAKAATHRNRLAPAKGGVR